LKNIQWAALPALFLLLCSCYASRDTTGEEQRIAQYFEEADNRVFEVSYPVQVEAESYVKIVAKGILDTGETYAIDTFAVNEDTGKRFFYDEAAEQFRPFYTEPFFACKTSPDGKLRAESVGMNGDGPSGLHALAEMRVIELSTGEILWSGESLLDNKFVWSEDSRWVAAEYAGRQFRETLLLDTETFAVLRPPTADDILKQRSGYAPPDPNGTSLFRFSGWKAPNTAVIGFEWTAGGDAVVTGSYEFDAASQTMRVGDIQENRVG
jgi:hypothetical protein